MNQSTLTTLKKLIPLVRVYGSVKIVYGQLQKSAKNTDTVERVHAACNAVTMVTGTVLVVRALRRGEQE